jgi:catechol 2,3-dioxygenase-like lactoylglutathione lyase family enzyme
MPHVYGILETALYVNDLQRSAEFYQRIFHFSTLLDSDRLIALDVGDRDVLLLFKRGATYEPMATPGGIIPAHDGTGRNHFAFAIDGDDVMPWQRELESLNIAVESVVQWPGGATSVYFRDPDEHLVELITGDFWKKMRSTAPAV